MNHSQDESASAYNFTEIVTNAVRTSMCTVSANCVPGPDLPDAFFLQATMAINATTMATNKRGTTRTKKTKRKTKMKKPKGRATPDTFTPSQLEDAFK